MAGRNLNKSVFYIDETEPYNGPDRRHYQRRNNPDRRADVRFEMDKEPRRKGFGRRVSESAWERHAAL